MKIRRLILATVLAALVVLPLAAGAVRADTGPLLDEPLVEPTPEICVYTPLGRVCVKP